MRRVIGLLILAAGCASPDNYRPGPPVTVAEPTYSGPAVDPPRAHRGAVTASGTLPAAAPVAPATAQPCDPLPPPPPPPQSSLMTWLRSGRGWTWGRASREPIRDEGLDRLMIDTLSSSRPQPSRDPLPPVTPMPGQGGPWIYPSAP